MSGESGSHASCSEGEWVAWRKDDPITGVITKADKRPQEAVASSPQSARKGTAVQWN